MTPSQQELQITCSSNNSQRVSLNAKKKKKVQGIKLMKTKFGYY